jgi:menaquinol-cytochrome c reductase iron-sulfur subunit
LILGIEIVGNEVTRRTFLARATAAIGGVLTAGFGIPAIAYFISPAKKGEQTSRWLSLGSSSKVEIGTPTLFKTTIDRTTGWVTETEEVSFYVITENARDYEALSNVCTHLGCRVRWVTDQTEFFCPCHGGVFSKDGTVEAGPPPRPLDRFDVREVNGTLEVDFSG